MGIGSQIIAGGAKVAFSEKAIGWASGDGGHEAAVGVDPFGIAGGFDAVADEAGAGGAEGDEFVRVDGEVGGGFRAEG